MQPMKMTALYERISREDRNEGESFSILQQKDYLETYAAANGFVVRGLDFSPVKGPEGNIEYLMFVQKSEQPGVLDDSVAEQVVAASHSSLDK